MAAPQFVPVNPVDKVKAYESNDHVPETWKPDRPGELIGRQPAGKRIGFQGPDQGYGLLLAEKLRERVQAQPGESVDDLLRGALNIGLRRSSMYGRAPVIHDLTMALTMWGCFDVNPTAELIAARKAAFGGLRHVTHHYEAGRTVVDSIPEATMRMSPSQVEAAYPSRWRELVGLDHS